MCPGLIFYQLGSREKEKTTELAVLTKKKN